MDSARSPRLLSPVCTPQAHIKEKRKCKEAAERPVTASKQDQSAGVVGLLRVVTHTAVSWLGGERPRKACQSTAVVV